MITVTHCPLPRDLHCYVGFTRLHPMDLFFGCTHFTFCSPRVPGSCPHVTFTVYVHVYLPLRLIYTRTLDLRVWFICVWLRSVHYVVSILNAYSGQNGGWAAPARGRAGCCTTLHTRAPPHAHTHAPRTAPRTRLHAALHTHYTTHLPAYHPHISVNNSFTPLPSTPPPTLNILRLLFLINNVSLASASQ